MIKDVIANMNVHMDKSIEALRKEYQRVRTGRASTSLLDEVRVDFYGTPSPISQVATLAVPEPRTVTIQPWEPKMIQAIEKAIMNANLGLTPANDGKVIRLNLPPLTGAVSVTSSDAHAPVDIMVKQDAAATYIFAAAMRNQPATASFKCSQPTATQAEVLGENRTLALTNGGFTDAFAPYAVHLYRLH